MSTRRQLEGRRETISKKIKEYLALGGDFLKILHEPLHEFDEVKRAEVWLYVSDCILKLDYPLESALVDKKPMTVKEFKKFVLKSVKELRISAVSNHMQEKERERKARLKEIEERERERKRGPG